MDDETIEDVKAAYALLHRDMAALRVKADALKHSLLLVLSGTRRDCSRIAMPNNDAIRSAFESLDNYYKGV